MCLHRCPDHLDPASDRDGIEARTELCVVITNEVFRRDSEGHRFPQLQRDPCVGRRARDADMDDTARRELGIDEGEEWPEEHIADLEEVTGPDVLRMVIKKHRPHLFRRSLWACPTHVALNRPLRDLDANLHQFTLDALAPHNWLFVAISLINAIVSTGNFGSCDRARDSLFQNNRKPCRCQRSTISGLMMSKASCQLCSLLASRMKRPRSEGAKYGHLTERLSKMSYWRSKAFSVIS